MKNHNTHLWVSVEKQLPKESSRYLVYLGRGINEQWVGDYDVDSKIFKKDSRELKYVTHWMPLLEAP